MSEQSTPPKPKPGSLRDRIAAFEKPAAASGQPTGPPPVPRPKPGGLSWKPKPPSPPSSPLITESSSDKKPGGMSAMDAKESIGKGGSLKERMAALQNRGAFGAPPPVAPKPPSEKPKWKPPPVVAPVDKEDDEEQTRDAELPRSPPPVRKLTGEGMAADTQEEAGGVSAAAEGEEREGVDAEEEERQRRAGIAARLARLGGTKVGMGPPLFAPKPSVKKPEASPETAKPQQLREESGEFKSTDSTTSLPENAREETSQRSPEPKVKSPQPARKSSASSASLSPEPVSQQSQSPPTSMPLPAAPRRAGPPRKKSAKSPEIPPPSSPPILGEQLVVSPGGVPQSDTPFTSPPVAAKGAEEIHAGDVQKEVHEPEFVESMARDASEDDEHPVISRDSAAQDTPVRHSSAHETDVVEKPEDVRRGEVIESEDEDRPAQSPTEDSQLHHDTTRITDQEQDIAKPHELLSEAEKELPEHVAEEPDVTEEDEEKARRQRIAEKLAKMGGVNPLGMPLQRRPSGPVEDVQISPTSPKKDIVGSPGRSPPPRRQSTRKSSSDVAFSSEASALELPSQTVAESAQPEASNEPLSSPKSVDDSKQPTRKLESTALPGVREEIKDNDIEGTSENDVDKEREPNSDRQQPAVEVEKSTEIASEDISDNENDVPSPPPPVVNRDSRPVVTPSIPVDPALVQPIPSVAATGPVPPSVSHSTRPVPPPRLVPQLLEAEEASDTESNYSPTPAISSFLDKAHHQDDEDDEPVDHLPPRSASTEESAEDESSPLPIPHRRSHEAADRDPANEQNRPISEFTKPPPRTVPLSVSDEQDSDLDEALPTRPLRRSVTPGTPPSNEIPLIVPPPTDNHRPEPSPLRQSFAPPVGKSPLSSEEGSPTQLSVSEVLDEDEGDPIDPSFHSPSRRASVVVPPEDPAPSQPIEDQEEDEQAERRRTIAERMARLGGIKFGAAPLQPPVSAVRKSRDEEESGDLNAGDQPTVEASEEEEERARKERIAAKLAGMGGMRIGMLPPGFGPPRPSVPRVPTAEAGSDVPPTRAVPPSRAPPPPAPSDSDVDPESSLSASQQSLSTSDEGVKVEAEESEIEEVSHADALDEELPPPVPARGPRRHGSESEQTARSSVSRPPVPTSLPARRPSTQTITSTARKSSADSSRSVTQKVATYKPQSEYVMVEEPTGFTPDSEVPPPPPTRPPNRPPPRGVPPPPQPPTTSQGPSGDSISSQWELPSIPTSSLEFNNTATDLSLSWPSDTNPAPSHSSPQTPIEKHPDTQTILPATDQHLSADDLMAVWGRVGVQVCEVATTLFEKSKKTLIGDGSYDGFLHAVLREVPNATVPPSSSAPYGYLIYSQTSNAVQRRASDIMPGDVIVLQDAKLKGHKGLQAYHQTVGLGEQVAGVVSEFEPKKSKVRVFQANQHVGQQTVEAASYRLEDLKSGTVKVYRVLEAK